MSLEIGLLLNAVNFAAIKHRDQRRKNAIQAPYINHPIGVAHILWEQGGVKDVDVLQAAILHDTIEDTDTTYEELVNVFGENVANIVKDVTDDKSKRKDQRKRYQVQHIRHISAEAKLVKLADKLYNTKDLMQLPPTDWDVERIQGYFVWTKTIVDSIRGTNLMLETELDKVFNATFKHTNGKKYPTIPKGIDLSIFLEEYYQSMKDIDRSMIKEKKKHRFRDKEFQEDVMSTVEESFDNETAKALVGLVKKLGKDPDIKKHETEWKALDKAVEKSKRNPF